MRIEFYHIDAMQAPHYEPIWNALKKLGVDARLVAIPEPENTAPKGWFDFDRLKSYYNSRKVPFFTNSDYNCSAITTGNEYLLKPYSSLHIRLMYGPRIYPAAWSMSEKATSPFGCLLVHGPVFVERFSKWKSKDNLLIVGYPRYDVFFANRINKTKYFSKLGLDKSRPTIVYFPTWAQNSSIDNFLDSVCSLTSEFNVLIKPHHCTLRMEPERLARIKKSGLAAVESSYDLPATLLIADLVIADIRSGAFCESIMLNNRTIGLVTFIEDVSQWIIPDGVLKLGPICTSPDLLRVMVNQLLNKDPYNFAREEWAEKNVSYRDGTASEHAANVIVELLERETVNRAHKVNNYRKSVLVDVPKKEAELEYWVHLSKELTKDCLTEAEKKEKLLRVCYEKAFPRYKKCLYLEDDTFAGKKILDLGCGPHCGIIGFKGCEKYGIDHLIKSYIKIGYPLAEHGVNYFNGKSEDMPFGNNFFDVVICVNTLDHVDDLQKTIKEISRVLKSGGKFMGQFNFRKSPTKTEPICLNHEVLSTLCKNNKLRLRNKIYQLHRPETKEDRYYYEFEKETRQLFVNKGAHLAEYFLEECIRDGLAHSYDVVRKVWVKPYPEATGYLLAYFANEAQRNDIPPAIIKAADTLVSIQDSTGGFSSFDAKDNLYTFDTGQIMHGLASLFAKTGETKYLLSAIACADFLCEMQLPDGSMFPVYNLRHQAKYVDKNGTWANRFSYIQAKNIEGLLFLFELTGAQKYRKVTEKLCDWSKRHCDLTYTHPGAYCLEGLLAFGETEFVRNQLEEKIIPRICSNGFLAYSEDLSYSYVSGSVQIAILLFKVGFKEESRRILEWARVVQSNHFMGGLFQYAQKDGRLDTHVHSEMNSWGTKYYAQLERLWG